ncbi:hypothetical protein FACS1894201_08820 [Bacteroidia bacterium]|nr:hypothetical protein FACS1894201_08820 [Bacteroidia bacterium]
MKKIAFIINPIAGGKAKRRLQPLIMQQFSAEEGFETTIYNTQGIGDATRAAADFVAHKFETIVAVGGDGTINEIAQALINTDVAMGIVPCGSGNGLARHLKIPSMQYKALSLIKQGETQIVDYCTINDKTFVCTAGIGFDALVGYKFACDRQRGILAYLKHILTEAILRYQPEQYRITLDGTTIERTAFLITFANASQWGNNCYIAPQANIHDGLLDVVIIHPLAWYQASELAIKLLTKQLKHAPCIEFFQCKHAIIERSNEGLVHFDGEPTIMGKHLEVKVFENKLRVIAINDKL